jgi:hypothetical protein
MESTGKLGALLARACGKDSPSTGTGGVGPPSAAERERAFEEILRLLSIFVRSSIGTGLRRTRESVDICQSVAKSLVMDLRDGKLEFENEAALVGYLQTVVRTKLAEAARHDRAVKRGGAANPGGAHASAAIPVEFAGASDPTASANAIEAEAYAAAMSQLSESEQDLVRLRKAGLEWDQISARLGRSSAALRKEWSRMQERMRGRQE